MKEHFKEIRSGFLRAIGATALALIIAAATRVVSVINVLLGLQLSEAMVLRIRLGLVGWAALLLVVACAVALRRYRGRTRKKIASLQSESAKLQAENTDLKQKLASQDGSGLQINTEQSLPEIQERILKILSAVDSMIDTELEKTLGVGEQLARYHVVELLRSRTIDTEPTYDTHSHWELTHKARAYLVKRNLLK